MIEMDIGPYRDVEEFVPPLNGTMGFAPRAIFNEDGEVVDEFKNLFAGFSPVLLYFATICIVVFMLVGIPGNLFTIIALARCKKVSELSRKSLDNYLCVSHQKLLSDLFLIRDKNKRGV